ncbi:hypothetical protein M8C21_009313 [Ambrosia artemisiifolia]|uniref:Uncharacterized protein n=1 Tax=Ambrosia artemisiifolia TaxID=4212 RepID=A0AAD5CY67_AMBAR|nr:hypothetical protein M8C21_009313 [Ambrosia artemisiifolia]
MENLCKLHGWGSVSSQGACLMQFCSVITSFGMEDYAILDWLLGEIRVGNGDEWRREVG